MTQKLNTILFIGFLIGEFIAVAFEPTPGMIFIALMFWIRLDLIDDETQAVSNERFFLVRNVRGRLEYLTRSDNGHLVELPDCKTLSFSESEAMKIDPKHEYIWEKEFTQ